MLEIPDNRENWKPEEICKLVEPLNVTLNPQSTQRADGGSLTGINVLA